MWLVFTAVSIIPTYLLRRKRSCQILWNGNYKLEITDRRKFAVLHFEGYYIALSDPGDVLKIGEQW